MTTPRTFEEYRDNFPWNGPRCHVTGNPCGTDTVRVGHCPNQEGKCRHRATWNAAYRVGEDRGRELEREKIAEAALASLPGEPVAWTKNDMNIGYYCISNAAKQSGDFPDFDIPFYLHPAPVRPAGMTQDKLDKMMNKEYGPRRADCYKKAQPAGDVGELVTQLQRIGNYQAGALRTEDGLTWHPANVCLPAATALLAQQAEIERLKAECAALRHHAEAMYRWITADGLVGWIDEADEANDYRVAFPARKP
jgi:hypothetical protein